MSWTNFYILSITAIVLAVYGAMITNMKGDIAWIKKNKVGYNVSAELDDGYYYWPKAPVNKQKFNKWANAPKVK